MQIIFEWCLGVRNRRSGVFIWKSQAWNYYRTEWNQRQIKNWILLAFGFGSKSCYLILCATFTQNGLPPLLSIAWVNSSRDKATRIDDCGRFIFHEGSLRCHSQSNLFSPSCLQRFKIFINVDRIEEEFLN